MAKAYTPLVTRGFDSPGLAIHNLTRLDPEGAVYSFLNTDQLSPEQRGLGQTGLIREEDGPFTRVLKTVGPIVGIGLVLSHAYPVATAKGLLRFSSRAKDYGKRLLPVAHLLQSPRRIFEKTNFLRLLERVVDDTHSFKEKITGVWSEGLLDYEARVGKAPGFRQQVAAAVHLDGLGDADNRVWQAVRAMTRRDLYREKYAHLSKDKLAEFVKHRVDEAIEQAVDRVGVVANAEVLRSAAPQELIDSGRKAVTETYKEMLKGGNLRRIAEARGMHDMELGERVRDIQRHLTAEQLFQQAEAMGIELPLFRPADAKKVVGEGAGYYRRYLQKVRDALTREEVFKYVDHYYPHIAERSPEEMTQQVMSLWEMTPAARRAVQTGEKAVSPISRQAERRLNRMIPSARDLESFLPDAFTPETYQALNRLSKTGKYHEYSLRLVPALQNYTHGMAKMYGWTARGWGRHLKGEVETKMLQAARTTLAGKLRYDLARNVYLPIAMGKLGPGESLAALGWGSLKKSTFDFFQNPKTWKVLGMGNEAQGQKMAGWFTEKLQSPRFLDLTFKNAGAKLAGYMYYSTLGLNPVSAGMNLMQNLMTTPGVVEPKYVVQGFNRAAGQMKKFIDLYAKGGRTLEQAFLEAIPEFAQIGGEIDTFSIVARSAAGGKALSKVEQAKQALMGMFSYSERFNRLWAYHAGTTKAVAEGLPDAAHRVGMEVMKLTQFPGGPLGTSALTARWWPPFRQFLHFPMRTAESFLHDPGTAGRMMAAGGAVYGAGRLAGVDLSSGLLFGALPAPMSEDQPFYPLPIQPPIVGVAGAVLSDLYSGSFEQTRKNLPLLVPAGTALARASTFIAPGLAEKIGRPYADYQNPLPDGRVPVYTANGELRGYESPMGMFARSIGWRSLTGDPEADLSRYLLAQRDKIRSVHRDYVESLARNDFTRAKAINEDYKRQFNLGDLVVKDTDIRAVHLRHDVARIERVLETMSPEARMQYGQYIALALGDSAESFFGVDPALLANPETPTIASRQAQRVRPTGHQYRQIQQMRGQSGADLRDDHIGRTPNEPFNAFQGFSPFGRDQ